VEVVEVVEGTTMTTILPGGTILAIHTLMAFGHPLIPDETLSEPHGLLQEGEEVEAEEVTDLGEEEEVVDHLSHHHPDHGHHHCPRVAVEEAVEEVEVGEVEVEEEVVMTDHLDYLRNS
jgi:hypothetical protein